MSGYAGKILRVDLTNRRISTIPTSDYDSWVGGHGLGSAVFWDLAGKKDISGFAPENVVTMMTSPLAGTLAPGASGRLEIQGVGVHLSPIEWFTRSNIGGRFAPMLKYAGFDGLAVEGRSERPVYLDVRDGRAEIKNAEGLWGLDAWQTQEEIWRQVVGSGDFKAWNRLGSGEKAARTTQRPAVLAIGQAGERLSRTACLIHDAGNASGQGGFGAVFGAKNLKAISVIGSGGVKIADPNALMEARLWAQKKYNLDLKNPKGSMFSRFGPIQPQAVYWKRTRKNGCLQACMGCHLGCRERTDRGYGNESNCIVTLVYTFFDLHKHGGKPTEGPYLAADLMQRYGINASEVRRGIEYLVYLFKAEKLGPGREIDCSLDFSQLGEPEFIVNLLRMIAFREGIGDDMAEGFYRASRRWGRLEEDLKSGALKYPYWGLPEHGYDPRVQFEWGYGTILGDRDVNEHSFTTLFIWPTYMGGPKTGLPEAERIVNVISEKLIPFDGDPRMLDYATDNIYSERAAKLVAWHRHYSRFWIQSALYCDLRWPDFFTTRTEDKRGLNGIGEPKFLNAVTGKNLSFLDGMKIGQRIWNLDNAIWTLQGRHRDMVHFSEYIYTKPYTGGPAKSPYKLPVMEDGRWTFSNVNGRLLDRSMFEEWKTRYYRLEGWGEDSGRPKRDTLSTLGLGRAADELEQRNILGG